MRLCGGRSVGQRSTYNSCFWSWPPIDIKYAMITVKKQKRWEGKGRWQEAEGGLGVFLPKITNVRTWFVENVNKFAMNLHD